MNKTFSAELAAAIGPRSGRPEAVRLAQESDVPSQESEDWRYSPIGDLPLENLSPVTTASSDENAPSGGLVATPAASVQVIDGFVTSITVDEGWASKGLKVGFEEEPQGIDRSAGEHADTPTIFDHLHQAFSPGALVIEAPRGVAVTAPIVIDTHHGATEAISFPHLVIRTAPASEVSVVERQTSISGLSASVPVVELDAGEASRLNYMLIQENAEEHWQIGRQISQVDGQATLSSGTAAFGGRYARTRSDSRLIGRGATANLVAAIYGDGDQILDFRTFQHHEARDTRSDLLFKGSQDDRSGSIYTGMIHIHPAGAGRTPSKRIAT